MSWGRIVRTVVYVCTMLGLVNYFFYLKYGHILIDGNFANRPAIDFDWPDFRTHDIQKIEPYKAGTDNLEGGETVIKWRD